MTVETVLVIVHSDLSLRWILVLDGVAIWFQMSSFIQRNLHANSDTVDFFTMSRYMSVQSGGFRCGPFIIKICIRFSERKEGNCSNVSMFDDQVRFWWFFFF